MTREEDERYYVLRSKKLNAETEQTLTHEEEKEYYHLRFMKRRDATRNFWKYRKNLSKDGRFVIYEDDDVLIYQERSGWEPLYMLWAILKNEGEHGRRRKLYKGYSEKFEEYWYEKSCYGIRDNSVKLVEGVDFRFVAD